MKKNYIIPSVEVYDVNADQNMLATSNIGMGDPIGDGETITADAPEIGDFEDVINGLGGLDANGNLAFDWE
ncbi:MAG: hypothetical protein KBT33_08525 [Prevotellaceae bacterium]|nr:hypothetical protein [Candidatus Minthosoma equi]